MLMCAGEKSVSAGFVAGPELGPRCWLDDIRPFLCDPKWPHPDYRRHSTYGGASRAAEG